METSKLDKFFLFAVLFFAILSNLHSISDSMMTVCPSIQHRLAVSKHSSSLALYAAFTGVLGNTNEFLGFISLNL